MMMLAIETIVSVVLAALLLIWFLVKIRRFGRQLKERGFIGLGVFLAALGAILLFLAYITVKLNIGLFSGYEDLYMQVGTALLGIGAVLIIFDRIYSSWKKEMLLRLEKERREYIERVRYGLKIDEAEKIAKRHIKETTGKETSLIASKKEFKRWAVYLKDKEGSFYRVIVDEEGRVEEWETLKELPRYFLGV